MEAHPKREKLVSDFSDALLNRFAFPTLDQSSPFSYPIMKEKVMDLILVSIDWIRTKKPNTSVAPKYGVPNFVPFIRKFVPPPVL